MVGSLGVCGRVAAVALLAVSSAVPHSGLVASAAAPAPVADVVTSCSVTVGTATTDPARAGDAARALAVGYAVTDCMPDATLIAAAEARAAISLPGTAADSGSIVGGAVAGTSSGPEGGSATAASPGTGTGTAASVPSTSVVTTTSAPATTTAAAAATTPSSTETTTSSSSGTSDTDSSTVTTTGSSSPTSDTDSSTETTTGTSSPTSDTDTSTETTTGSSSPTSDTDSSTETTTSSSSPTSDSGTVDGGTSGDGSSNGSGGSDGGTTTGGTTDGTTTDGTTTAAGRYGWGQATRSEDFDGDLAAWAVYDGPGHAGKGRRSPAATSVANGVFTISGDSAGTTGGMAWRGGAEYGRWEARVKSPAADPTYNAVMLLWPDAENVPVGGEVDFMEISDETRQKAGFFLHYGESNRQLRGQVAIDATQWHNWAVEWAPDHITAYVDGQEWYTTRDTNAFPPGPMHLTLQLDWFPKGGGAVRPSTMSADWVRYYPIDGSGAGGAILNNADAGAGSFVGPQVVDAGGSGATADSVAGVTATSTTTVTRTASAAAAAKANGTTGTATASSAARAATSTAAGTVTTTTAARAVTAGSTDG